MIPILTYSDEMDKLRKRKGRKKDSTYYYITDIAQPLPWSKGKDGSSVIFTSKQGSNGNLSTAASVTGNAGSSSGASATNSGSTASA